MSTDKNFTKIHTSASENNYKKTSTSEEKSRSRVTQTAYYLESILKPQDNAIRLFTKFAWLYSETILIRLANEAKETDKTGTPTRLFVYLVKRELGYEKV